VALEKSLEGRRWDRQTLKSPGSGLGLMGRFGQRLGCDSNAFIVQRRIALSNPLFEGEGPDFWVI
jgi:hypothetical protein